MLIILLLIALTFTVNYSRSSEVDRFLNIFGEARGTYYSSENSFNFLVGDTDILGFIHDGKNKALIEIYLEQPDAFLDIERLYFERRFGDNFYFRVGKFHTPVGYFNQRWHHGLPLMTLIDRPHIVNFEDEGGPFRGMRWAWRPVSRAGCWIIP